MIKIPKLKLLNSLEFITPLGPMIAIADEQALYLLEFVERVNLERTIESLKQLTQSTIVSGDTKVHQSLKSELKDYFNGSLQEFKTPLFLIGSLFAQRVWCELQKIPHGQTRSYKQIAQALGQPTAYRAVARANSTNRLALIVPCHRVININNTLGGYAGGLHRKAWLLDHERGTV